ncbi:interleukin-21 receptor isoform X2 [Erythrolamprus reginae]|uniref:interleukin-21 receptor isoform X2 n=1 Tax=Erythrolamprus reginae TaxID=121349 RepID=UPI00396CDFC1
MQLGQTAVVLLLLQHAKPHPPTHLAAATSSAGYTLSWESKYLDPEYPMLSGHLKYELRYKKKGHPWQGQSQKSIPQDLRSIQLLPQELESDAEYEFQVRSGPAMSYQGTWSDWSPPTSLKTTHKASEHGAVQWLELFLLVLSSAVALMAFLGWHQRLWKKLDCFTPSPAPFFQPLYLRHNGDFKKWVGAPRSGTTLDAFEWGIVVPEVFGIGHKHLLLGRAEGDWSDGQNKQPPMSAPLLPGHLQAFAKGCSATTWEQGYGRLSIGTVTVAEDFATHCPQCSSAHPCWAPEEEELQEETATSEEEAYRGLQLDGSGSLGLGSGRLLVGNEVPLQDSFPPGPASWTSHPSFGSPTGGPGGFFGLVPDPSLLGLSAPAPAEGLLYRGPPSPDWEGESDPVSGLDLDTIDSGFAECECRSPGGGELTEMPSGCSCQSDPGPVVGEPEQEDFFLPRYVKQWI